MSVTGTKPAFWQDRAACGKYLPAPGELWPWDTGLLRGKGAALRMKEREDHAKAVCATCPVRADCLDFGIYQAIENDIVEGIWGGLNPQELAATLGVRLRFSSGIPVFDDRPTCT